MTLSFALAEFALAEEVGAVGGATTKVNPRRKYDNSIALKCPTLKMSCLALAAMLMSGHRWTTIRAEATERSDVLPPR